MIPRSWLYVPGDRPDMLAKAAERGADALILDLEDGVAPAGKLEARKTVAAWLRDRGGGPAPEAWVRVNPDEPEDVRAAFGPGLRGLVLPKVSSPDDIARVRAQVRDADVPIVALIETAAGLLNAPAIATTPPVARLAIGEVDLAAELGLDPSPDGRELDPLRLQLVVASAAAGLEPPVAPVSRDFSDLEGLRDETERLRRLGFVGRAAIHPAQVAVINEVFTPTAEELDAARRLLARHTEAGGGVTLDDAGLMVDEAVVRTARRKLALADEEGEEGAE